MHGNIAEWCLDRYDPNYYTADLMTDPVCTQSILIETDLRVVRGGSIADDNFCRSSSRNFEHNFHAISLPNIGFRVVLYDPSDSQSQ